MNEAIVTTFNNIPSQDILEIARNIQQEIKDNSSIIERKNEREFVTKADYQIQRLLLDYFANSKLSGTYTIRAEESLSIDDIKLQVANKNWQLIIDPLDGTNPFCKGENSWGTMVGLCDRSGKLIYSWNLISSGQVFSSFSSAAQLSLAESQRDSYFNIDVDNYGNGASQNFPNIFEKISKSKYNSNQIKVTAYPAAIWAGWELYEKRLNALLWLPGKNGKGCYPDYDLIFLGSLQQQGWKIVLGKHEGLVQVVAVASNDEELGLLWETAMEMMDKTLVPEVSYETELKISLEAK